jgi:ribosomal protein S21
MLSLSSTFALRARAHCRSLYVKVGEGQFGAEGAALTRLQAKSEREGIDREIKARRNFLKPTLERQRNTKGATFNSAKRVRLQLVEELLLDKRLNPF